ncbi:hypothetical protein AB0I81_48020 [Nonomuraea sp. NPDC050404]|uniref:hypothetical protein n=1 Tax=Nonomuraea sp. NPDC050404 TaxID=3155783 RepID=UPI0033D54475
MGGSLVGWRWLNSSVGWWWVESPASWRWAWVGTVSGVTLGLAVIVGGLAQA